MVSFSAAVSENNKRPLAPDKAVKITIIAIRICIILRERDHVSTSNLGHYEYLLSLT